MSLSNVDCYGHYWGLVMNPSQLVAHNVRAKWCIVGVGLETANAFHAGEALLSTEWCQVHVAPWSSTGAWNAQGNVIAQCRLAIRQWQIEDAEPDYLFATTLHVHDPTHGIRGRWRYNRVAAEIGIAPGPLLRFGGNNITFEEM